MEYPLKIIHVEDSADMIDLVQLWFAEEKIPAEFKVFRDGAEMLHFLEAQDSYQTREAPFWPHFILLDLRLPGLSGFNVLSELKRNPLLQAIPVVMHTVSDANQDFLRSYQLGGTVFVSKLLGKTALIEAVRRLALFSLFPKKAA